MKDLKLIIYSILHFLVDLTCITIVYTVTNNIIELAGALIIIYNFLAFAMQLPLGMLIDKIRKNNKFAIGGIVLIIISVFLIKNAFLAILFAGIGNSLFHLGAGVEILELSKNKASKIGIFVSTGALGVFLAKHVNSIEILYLVLVFLLILSIVALYLFKDEERHYNKSYILENKNKFFNIAFLLLIAIFVRAFIGFVVNYEWQSNFSLAFLMVLGVFLGKFFGGIIADKYGLKRTTVLSLSLSCVCLLLGYYYFIFGIIGIFLFNMVMPITLILLSNTFQKNKGFAFGVSTFALFLGFFIELLTRSFFDDFIIKTVICICIIISILCIVKSISYFKEK